MSFATVRFLTRCALWALIPWPDAQGQERLEVGDLLEINQLDLKRFGDQTPLDLEQFAGKILYLEWFYWW